MKKKTLKYFKVVRQDPKKNEALIKPHASQVDSYIDYYNLFKKLEQ